jgi:hypothetical protein
VLLDSEMYVALENIRRENEKNVQFEANQLKKLLVIEAWLKDAVAERTQHEWRRRMYPLIAYKLNFFEMKNKDFISVS